MKRILIAFLLLISISSLAQTGQLMQRYYVSGSMSIGQNNRLFADSSAWLQIGGDTTFKGVLLPRVLLDSIATSKRGLYVYDLEDSVLYHFDGSRRVRYMTYKDTVLIKQLIAANPPDLSAYFREGGNAWGHTAVLGTTDDKGINIVVDDTAAVSISNKRVWTKHGRTDVIQDIPLRIGTGYEMYDINHASDGFKTYISGYGGDFASGYGLVFGKPSNKIALISDAQIQLNQHVVIPTGKTIQVGNITSFDSSPYTGLKYPAAAGWHFAIRDAANNNRLAIMNNGNVLINSSTDDNYKLSVTGTARVTDDLFLDKKLTFRTAGEGVQINGGTAGSPDISVFIGRNPGSYPTTGNRHIKIGTSNNTNPVKSFNYAIGTANNLSAAGSYVTCLGTFNTVNTEDNSQVILGDNNTINFTGFTTSRGQCVIGSTNIVSHLYSSIIGNHQQTTATNQLIIADGNPNFNHGGYRDVYFGSGAPRSSLQGGLGAPVTINASGGNGTDKDGGLLRLAAGKGTGSATPADVVIATSTAIATGDVLQALTDRWYVKGGSGRLSNTIAPTALFDVSATTGYNQLRMRTAYTPSSTADANGSVGDVAWDDDYLYIKTSEGWKRTTLSDF